MNFSKLFLLGFLKGLIDTDGSVYQENITIYTSSLKLKNQICKILAKFNLRYGIYKDKRDRKNINYRIDIWKKDSKKLISMIKPWKGQ